MASYCYRFVDSQGNVIYYGKTVNIDRRIQDHFAKGHLSDECYRSVARIEYQKYKTESDSLIMETYFICKYNPKYNKMQKSRDMPTIEMDEGKWKLYKQIKPIKPLQKQNTGFVWKLVAFMYLLYMILKLFGII